MAQPASIVNDRGQSTDTIYVVGGGGRIKLGLGTVDVSEDEDAAYQGVATALDEEDFVAGDGVVVVAGVDATGVTRHALVDDGGLLHVAIGGGSTPTTLTDASDSATGATQEVLAADTDRRYLFIQNVGADDLWVNFTDDADDAPGSILLSPGAALEYSTIVPTEAVNVLGAVGEPFTVKAA